MKKVLTTGIAAMAIAAAAGAMTLSEANGKLAEAAEKSDTMSAVTKGLSAGDQVKFLNSVNGAIAAMPVSDAEKTAKYVDASKAALKNAADGNLTALVAETFATASLESLAQMNEQFAKELFNRNADAAHPVSDADMKSKATATLDAVKARNAKSDVSNADERNALAALMFIRASEGKPADLRKELTDSLGNDEAAGWIAAALGEGEPKTYEPILGTSESEEESGGRSAAVAPNVMVQTPADGTAALLGGLADTVGSDGKVASSISDVALDMDATQYALPESLTDVGMNRVPRTLNPEKPYYNGIKRGDSVEEEDEPYRYPYE